MTEWPNGYWSTTAQRSGETKCETFVAFGPVVSGCDRMAQRYWPAIMQGSGGIKCSARQSVTSTCEREPPLEYAPPLKFDTIK